MVLVIGIGNEYRGDDAAGLAVARQLKERAGEAFTVLEHSGEGASLLESWKDARVVLLIDAVRSGAAPGTVHRFDATTRALPSTMFRHSTHAFSVVEAVELARALGRLPQRLIVYGIEGKEFESGTSLSPKVESAVPGVVKKVLAEIQKSRRRNPVGKR